MPAWLRHRIDGDALDRAVGGWLADRRPVSVGLRGLSVNGKSLRGVAKARGRKIHLLAAWSTPLGWSWPSLTSVNTAVAIAAQIATAFAPDNPIPAPTGGC